MDVNLSSSSDTPIPPLPPSFHRQNFREECATATTTTSALLPIFDIETTTSHLPQSQQPVPIQVQQVESDPNSIKIQMLESEVIRLQELCREKNTDVDKLRKENSKLLEVLTELRDTTMDLAFSLAEGSLWLKADQQTSFKVLTKYTKSMQYILHLPVFVDPIEQLVTIGMDPIKAENYLENQYLKKRRRKSKIQRGNSQPTVLYKCKRCRKKPFLNHENSDRHTKIHKSKKFKCVHCLQCFESLGNYKSHWKVCSYYDNDNDLKSDPTNCTSNNNWFQIDRSCSNSNSSSSSNSNNNNWASFYGDPNDDKNNLIDFTHVLWPQDLSDKFPDLNVCTYVANANG